MFLSFFFFFRLTGWCLVVPVPCISHTPSLFPFLEAQVINVSHFPAFAAGRLEPRPGKAVRLVQGLGEHDIKCCAFVIAWGVPRKSEFLCFLLDTSQQEVAGADREDV